MSIVFAHDATHQNIGHLPPGQACGYTTGSPSIAWTEADWKVHPGAVRICQDAGATDHTADALDVERFAATNAEAASWYHAAVASFRAVVRPGQREPAIYTSASNVTPLVNALIAGGVTSGPKLWIADWNDAVAADQKAVQDASGPFPIIGFQYINGPFFDSDLFSGTWLADVSQSSTAGAHRHILHTQSLADFAAGRNTRVPALLARTAAEYTTSDAATVIDGLIVYTANP